MPGPISLVAEFDLPVDQGEVRGLAFSPDDAFIYAAGSRGSVKKWDLASRSATQEYRGQQGQLKTLALSPNGKLLAAGGSEQMLDVWDTATGQSRFRQTLSTGDIVAIAFSPDGQWLAVGTHALLRLYRVIDDSLQLHGDLASSTTRPVTGYIVEGLAFSPDSQRLAAVTWGETSVAVWQLPEAQLSDRLPRLEHEPMTLIFADTGRQLLFAYRTGPIKRWIPGSGRPAETIFDASDEVRAMALAPDRRTLAMVGPWGGPLRLFDVQTGGSPRTIRDNSNAASYCLIFSHDHQRLAIGGGSDTTSFIKLWRVIPATDATEP
jgi:WD40 repeat protein